MRFDGSLLDILVREEEGQGRDGMGLTEVCLKSEALGFTEKWED